MTAKRCTRISQHCAINSRQNSMTINAESTLIIYTMMDLKLAVNIQGRLQSNHLGRQFSMCHLHAPQQSEGKHNPRNYHERIGEEWNTIATISQTHVPNTGSSSAPSSQKGCKSVMRNGMKGEHRYATASLPKRKKSAWVWRRTDSGWRGRDTLAVVKNQKLHGEDEHRATVHALCQDKSSRASRGSTRQQAYDKKALLPFA